MALIFIASSDSQSGEHSSRLLEPILAWLGLARQSPQIIFAVRKLAHMTEYAVLALLYLRALGRGRPFSSARAALALAFAVAYAASDEFHQTFVPTRSGSVSDVLMDSSGALIGLSGAWARARWQTISGVST